MGWGGVCCSRVSGVLRWVGCSTAVPPQFFTVSQHLLHSATIATLHTVTTVTVHLYPATVN